MSEINQVLNSIAAAPELLKPSNWKNPEAIVGVPLAAAALALRSTVKFGKRQEKRYTSVPNAQHKANITAAEKAKTANQSKARQVINTDKLGLAAPANVKTRRRQTLNPGRLGLAGAAVMLTSIVGMPHRPAGTPESRQDKIVIQSETSSMQLTRDLSGANGLSREQVVDEGLLKAKYSGKLTIIQPGSSPVASVSATRDWRNKNAIDTSRVDPQDAGIASTIGYAASLLPNAPVHTGKVGKVEKTGEIIVLSDGIVSDPTSSLAATAKTVRDEGVKVKFVVPGTSTGRYKIDSESPYTPSAVQPGNFDAFGTANVDNTTSAEATERAINNDLGFTSANPLEVSNEALLLEVGGLMMLGGLAWSQSQRINRR